VALSLLSFFFSRISSRSRGPLSPPAFSQRFVFDTPLALLTQFSIRFQRFPGHQEQLVRGRNSVAQATKSAPSLCKPAQIKNSLATPGAPTSDSSACSASSSETPAPRDFSPQVPVATAMLCQCSCFFFFQQSMRFRIAFCSSCTASGYHTRRAQRISILKCGMNMFCAPSDPQFEVLNALAARPSSSNAAPRFVFYNVYLRIEFTSRRVVHRVTCHAVANVDYCYCRSAKRPLIDANASLDGPEPARLRSRHFPNDHHAQSDQINGMYA